MPKTNNNDLTRPLLGIDNDDEDVVIERQRQLLCEAGAGYGIDVEVQIDDDDDVPVDDGAFVLCGDDNEPVYRFNWCDSIMIWMVLPTLLWLDFGMAFLMLDDPDNNRHQNPVSSSCVNFKVVNLSLLMFVVSSYLYRKVVEECKVNCLFVVLLPEIVMDVVLAVILADKVIAAYLVLLFSILGLSMVVVVHSVYGLCTEEEEEDDEETAPIADSEMAVTHYKGGRATTAAVVVN